MEDSSLKDPYTFCDSDARSTVGDLVPKRLTASHTLVCVMVAEDNSWKWYSCKWHVSSSLTAVCSGRTVSVYDSSHIYSTFCV